MKIVDNYEKFLPCLGDAGDPNYKKFHELFANFRPIAHQLMSVKQVRVPGRITKRCFMHLWWIR